MFTALKHRLEYALFVAVRWVLMALGTDRSSALMGRLWRWFAPFNERHGRVFRHMEWALGPAQNRRERARLVRQMWENLGRTFAEGMIADKIDDKAERITINSDDFEAWATDEHRKGAIFLSHHFGNWELNGSIQNWANGASSMALYRRMKNPLVDQLTRQIRSESYADGLYTAADNAGVRILSQLKRGQSVGILGDLRDDTGILVRFFGMPARMTPFPAKIARRLGCPLFVCQMRRVEGCHFVFDCEQIDIPHTKDRDADAAMATQRVFSIFERWIRENPDQWMWATYRWSGRYDAIERPRAWDEHIHHAQ